MTVTAAFAVKVNTTYWTDDVFVALDLVEEEVFFHLKLDVAFVAVFMLRRGGLVFLHVLICLEPNVAAEIGTFDTRRRFSIYLVPLACCRLRLGVGTSGHSCQIEKTE